jgi:hypothetical protein
MSEKYPYNQDIARKSDSHYTDHIHSVDWQLRHEAQAAGVRQEIEDARTAENPIRRHMAAQRVGQILELAGKGEKWSDEALARGKTVYDGNRDDLHAYALADAGENGIEINSGHVVKITVEHTETTPFEVPVQLASRPDEQLISMQ